MVNADDEETTTEVDEVSYTYRLGRGGSHRFQMFCEVPSGLDDVATLTALRAMYDNAALEGFEEGRDYRWDGCNGIAFRKKAMLAQFMLFLP